MDVDSRFSAFEVLPVFNGQHYQFLKDSDTKILKVSNAKTIKLKKKVW